MKYVKEPLKILYKNRLLPTITETISIEMAIPSKNGWIFLHVDHGEKILTSSSMILQIN